MTTQHLDHAAVLDRFSPATRAWFTASFPGPTAAQTGAWDAISRGEHTLVVAPTGSGKTLSAFLWAIDRIVTSPPPTPRSAERARARGLVVRPWAVDDAAEAERLLALGVSSLFANLPRVVCPIVRRASRGRAAATIE